MTTHETAQHQMGPQAHPRQGAGRDGRYDDGTMHHDPGMRAYEDNVIYIGKNHVDVYAMDAVSILGKSGNVTLRSKGRSIPVAVTVANMVTREILRGSSRVGKILLDTDAEPGIGDMTSTIEIRLDRRR